MRFFPVFMICLLGVRVPLSQTSTAPRPIDVDMARKHFVDHADPIYPPIAKAAHVQGTVEINVVIGPSGKVTEEHVLSGPAMLQQAALDAIKKWTFKPFRFGGAAAAVSATFEIPFQIDKPGEGPTKEQQEAAQAWFSLSNKCRNAISAGGAGDALVFCKLALHTSLEAGDSTSSDQLARIESYQSYGHALILAGKFPEALEAENNAIDEAKKGLKDTDQEYAMPFFWRALAEVNLNQTDAALADFQMAEATHRRAMKNLPDMAKVYSGYLASILRTHAALLDKLGRGDEAGKLRAEAATLQE